MGETHEVPIGNIERNGKTEALRKFIDEVKTNTTEFGERIADNKILNDLDVVVGVDSISRGAERAIKAITVPAIYGWKIGREIISGKVTPGTQAASEFMGKSLQSVSNLLNATGISMEAFLASPVDSLATIFHIDKKQLALSLGGMGLLYIGRDLLFPDDKKSTPVLQGVLTAVTLAGIIGMTQSPNPNDWMNDYQPGKDNLSKGATSSVREVVAPAVQIAKEGQKKYGRYITCGVVAAVGMCCCLAGSAFVAENYLYNNNAEFKVFIDSRSPKQYTPTPEPTKKPLTDTERFQAWVDDNYVKHKDEANPLDVKNDMVEKVTAYVGPTWMWKKERLDYLNQIFGEKFKKLKGHDINEVDVQTYQDPQKFIQLLKDLGYDKKTVDFYQIRTDLIGQPDAPDKFLEQIKNLGLDVMNFLKLVGFISAGQTLRAARSINIASDTSGRRDFFKAVKEYATAGVKAVKPELAGLVAIAKFLKRGLS